MSNSSIRTLKTALLRAEQFIVNGIEWGFITMPEDKGDPSHDTLPLIRAAITEADQSLIPDEVNQVIGCNEKPAPRPLSAGMVDAMREAAHSPGRSLKEPIASAEAMRMALIAITEARGVLSGGANYLTKYQMIKLAEGALAGKLEQPAPAVDSWGNRIECPYCEATEGLRVKCDGGGYIAPEYTCEACFKGQDDGPCFDDLPPAAAPKIEGV